MTWTPSGPQASLDLTHVLYDDDSYFSLALALLTLSPILLMPAYAALAVQTREYVIIIMWAGQLIGEVLNLVIKHTVKQARPSYSAANGYGFPSSHSQYMGYFATYLVLHLYCRHRFASSGYKLLDGAWRLALYAAIISWAGVVAYSRYYLRYHSPSQIWWGLGIGTGLGAATYTFAELLPRKRPHSALAKLKTWLVRNPVSNWLQIRDGWDVWADGGRETEWLRWRDEWERRRVEKSK
ncbi:acidPPc domain-containing protein [Mycena indigotica]|uniref:AcidPPc domain-containing protein n=1 Tax=Mycena indigotica TaxID=2126181 RepID=A0A8H6T0U0_9AGAR|nr:acidPPc domain-containing protein [Mycena indigotica]KAF7309875.1 acidPPc domain-containing protein [Mycena indigotica]